MGEDSDDWLGIDEEMLDGMLDGSESTNKPLSPKVLKNGGENEVAGAQAELLHKLAGKVRHFVEGEGDLEGAKFEEYVQLRSPDMNMCLMGSGFKVTYYQMKNFLMKIARELVTTQCLTLKWKK